MAHPAGVIVAEHDLGVGGSGTAVPAEDWAYNISSDAPHNSNGKQFNTVNATWIANNLTSTSMAIRSATSVRRLDLRWRGIGQYLTNPLIDTNNDLIGDAGVTPAGVNVRGQGLETFYSTVRQLLPPRAILVGGTGLVRGFISLNGVQNEGYPHVSTSYVSPADYKLFDQKLDHYTYHVHEV